MWLSSVYTSLINLPFLWPSSVFLNKLWIPLTPTILITLTLINPKAKARGRAKAKANSSAGRNVANAKAKAKTKANYKAKDVLCTEPGVATGTDPTTPHTRLRLMLRLGGGGGLSSSSNARLST